ncbi:hypothetical protein, partial [uncultured Prevotella sp.]|uniref:hypothetical protein n=1 Tax=uncultured Prevotella sp. TaxID=159272 RepID=UPI002588C9E1
IFKENLSMEILETKGRKMNKIKREERENLHTFSDTTPRSTVSALFATVFSKQCTLVSLVFSVIIGRPEAI